jgi:hypothetical protein
MLDIRRAAIADKFPEGLGAVEYLRCAAIRFGLSAVARPAYPEQLGNIEVAAEYPQCYRAANTS